METNDFKLDEVEEKRRGGLYKLARALHLPRKMLEDAASWKRTRAAMITIITFVTVVPAAAVTISKKTTPIEGIQVASIVPTASQPAASKSSTDANLPTYFRVVDSGQKCGDRKVEVGDPDTVPGYPKLTALLATNPCFNFGWIEENKQEYGGKVGVINYIPANHRSEAEYSLPGMSKDLEEGAKYTQMAMDMNEINGALNAFALDMVWKLSGPAMVEEVKKLTKKLEQERDKSKPRDQEFSQAMKDNIFWNMMKKVAYSEGLTIRLSDATREREEADKIPGDFMAPDNTADRYKLILARMSPSNWEKFQMTNSFSGVSFQNGDIEKTVVLIKEALSYLKDPREIHAAVERVQKGLQIGSTIYTEPAKRAITELGLS